MRGSALLLCLSLLLLACENQTKEKATTHATRIAAPADTTATAAPDALPSDRHNYFIWNADSETKTKRRNPAFRGQYQNVDSLIMGLNERYPKIRMEKRRLENDTLYTEIRDGLYLTEQMGSSGAEQYIAQAVLNLTAVRGVNYVRIDFAEGSHASPDVWSKDSFSDYKEVK